MKQLASSAVFTLASIGFVFAAVRVAMLFAAFIPGRADLLVDEVTTGSADALYDRLHDTVLYVALGLGAVALLAVAAGWCLDAALVGPRVAVMHRLGRSTENARA